MKDAWFDQKTLVIKTLNPKLKPVPSPPPPGSLPPPTKILNTKNDGGGGEGSRRTLYRQRSQRPWRCAVRTNPTEGFVKSFFLQLQTNFRRRQKSEQQAFGDVRIQALGTNLWKLDNSIAETNSLFYQKNSGQILSVICIFFCTYCLFKRYSVRN